MSRVILAEIAPLPAPEEQAALQAQAAVQAEQSRLARFTALAALSGVLLVAGCTSETSQSSPHPSESPHPTDTRPAVAALAHNGKYPSQLYTNTFNLSYPLGQAIKEKQLPDYTWYGSRTHDDTFPVEESAPLFTVLLGTDGHLRVEDQTKGVVSFDDEKELLGAVQTNDTLLTGLMQAQDVHSVRFRIFKPDMPGSDPEFTPASFPFFEPKDPTDPGHNNIYYYLPAQDILDQQAIATEIQHESMHAALQQGLETGKLSAGDIALVGKACTTLRDSA